MRFELPGYELSLRPIALTDVDNIMSWINDPDVTRNFASMGKTISRADELAFLERTIASDTDRLYAIEDADGNYIGNAGLHKIYWPAKNARIGVVIGEPGARGRGYGQQVLRLLCALAFMRLGLHKVWLIHFDTNARMAHIVNKLGFVYEGTLRDEYYTSKYHDMLRHSLLESDFARLRRSWDIADAL
jgi:RimJ/RimL family protein N-acetyltransferase